MTDSLALGLVLAADGGHHFWPLWMLLWIGVIGLVIWLVVRRTRPRGPSGHDSAKQILAERFARGELSGEEYRERLAELG
jgi:putative membrane protein